MVKSRTSDVNADKHLRKDGRAHIAASKSSSQAIQVVEESKTLKTAIAGFYCSGKRGNHARAKVHVTLSRMVRAPRTQRHFVFVFDVEQRKGERRELGGYNT